ITLLGGLAMFLYGMRLMGDGLKGGASATLKKAIEKVTDNPVKAFFLGLAVTAIIQSSTATIVITSGLVGAGIIKLDQSLGIIIGSNVGTTVTGQIIRLLDINADEGSVLQLFQPSTLAPVALIIGMVIIMGFKFKKSEFIGSIAIGFGILFSGLMSMTGAVSTLTEPGGPLENVFSGLGNSPLISYAAGAGTAFLLQSSSATIGIMQAFSMSGTLIFKSVFIILVGIYLGDCVTTAIVCSIGAKADAKRVGIVNILFNLSETVLVLAVVNILHAAGLLDNIWELKMTSGTIANTNTVFNLGCSILLLPMVGVYEKLSRIIVKDDNAKAEKYGEKLSALNPVFFDSPAIAFNSCYELLKMMYDISVQNIFKAYNLLFKFDGKTMQEITEDEDAIDRMADAISNYLIQLSSHISEASLLQILDEYNKITTCFERLGDHAMNLAEDAEAMNAAGFAFSDAATAELLVIKELLEKILGYARTAFSEKNLEAATAIEPLEEVVDDLINTLQDNHLVRLRDGKCTVTVGMHFLNILTNLERISDVCSDIGVATIARRNPELANQAHEYISSLHMRNDSDYADAYKRAHDEYFSKLTVTQN
ncbi:MAG: Na/Pi cotransporter family protein, partial [Clostridiales bacterium]|nr:Na/Pi cotransporter family protein [Candidatus Equinaster intestinalis]